jgi:hypothetical protein
MRALLLLWLLCLVGCLPGYWDSGGSDSTADADGTPGGGGGRDAGVGLVRDAGGGGVRDAGAGAVRDAATPGDADSAVRDEWFFCRAADDCEVIETGCCDHCNGGAVISVNDAYARLAREHVVQTDCEGIECTERACAAEVPTCEDGRCGSIPDPGWIGPEDCELLDEVACEAVAACAPIRGAQEEDVCVSDFDTWNRMYRGCRAAEIGCGEAETCANDPESGRRMTFPDTCIPAGWAVCDAAPCEVATTCGDAELAAPGRLCVLGTVEGRVVANVEPAGCFSSSCTVRADVFCVVSLVEDELAIDASFCLKPVVDPVGCSEDCGGGGSARCLADLPPGTYRARMGNLAVDFEHPGPQVCAGAGQ